MMASTMTIPPMTAMPNMPGPLPTQRPIPGLQGPLPGGYPCPVSMQGPIISGPVVNRTTTPSTNVPGALQHVRVPVVPVGGGCYNDGMEVVWHGEFSRLFSSFFPPHVWYLSITNVAPQEKWKFYRDSAKVRFCCQDCGNGWTSMKGRVTFWFHLNMSSNEGFVQFKLYGQVCKKCSSGKFEYVMWYPEEVSKVMCNLYNKVGQTYYGFMQPPIRIDRRPGRPRNQHNADLCQACRDGECDQARPIKAMYNYVTSPPLASPPSNQPMHPRPPSTNVVTINHNGGVPIVVRPPHPPPPHVVMQAPINTSSINPPGSVVPVSHSGPQLITPPVTLTSGVQPILTYSIVTESVTEGVSATQLTPVSQPFVPHDSKCATAINGHAIEAQLTLPNTSVGSSIVPLVTAKPNTMKINGENHVDIVDHIQEKFEHSCAISRSSPIALTMTNGGDSIPKMAAMQKMINTVMKENNLVPSILKNGYATVAANGKTNQSKPNGHIQLTNGVA